MKATVFLGAGRITSALVAGLRLASYDRPIILYDHHPEKLRALRKLHGVATERNLQHAIGHAKILIIAVRPASVATLLQEISPPKRPLFAVSLAAGVPLSRLRKQLGPRVRWARAMPSPVCRTRQGLTALAFDRGFPRSARVEIGDLFTRVGQVLEISENKFDAFTTAFSPSHGYHALAALADAAQQMGLPRKIALSASAHALCDAIVAWREGKVSLAALLHEAATPGGTAAAVMNSMDKASYGSIVRRGLAAGIARARRNAKLG